MRISPRLTGVGWGRSSPPKMHLSPLLRTVVLFAVGFIAQDAIDFMDNRRGEFGEDLPGKKDKIKG